MDDYQSLVVAQFFEPLPNLSQESCHQFALHRIAPIVLPNTTGKLCDIATLPVTLAHQDLAPFNYLIDDCTGRVQAVLDWDGALYLPVGSNFHSIDNLFGFMTPSCWQDTEDRKELEEAFYNQALDSLAVKGFSGITKEQLESQKAIGILLYGVERLLRFKNERAEHYLEGYLQALSFMSGFIFSYYISYGWDLDEGVKERRSRVWAE
ncbi:hypothetical protein PENSUB_9420 [Penicillium subrubescens]|uniref:Aminoglycoside phosphotransferase domain-containing protein n=1 Tax=Penicillium subrubescens TaxID=1316194 RepID=A0A1Q5TDM5_9EURO|nr:hypothetical protein PENSUB_9420 [Penicillium subrubescens]